MARNESSRAEDVKEELSSGFDFRFSIRINTYLGSSTMIKFKFMLAACMVLLLAAELTLAQASAPDAGHTKPASQEESARAQGPKATLADAAWIAGDWEGNAMGGQFQESWNRPMGGSMVGMFKFVIDKKIGFYELLTIVETNGTLLLRLKHFDSKLAGWEAQDKSVEFPLTSISKKKVEFGGLYFEKIADDQIKIVVSTKRGDKTSELIFECKRAPTAAVGKVTKPKK